jgi:hypothetical protein
LRPRTIAAERLVQIALSETTEVKDSLVAIREILNRAGVGAEQMDDGSAQGAGALGSVHPDSPAEVR